MSGSGYWSYPRWRICSCAVVIAAFCAGGLRAGAATPTVPGPPTITSAVAGVQNATIEFTPPADDGGAHLFAYTATCASSTGALTASSSGGASPLRVGGMSSGTPYTCRVAARNAVGLGASSAVSTPVVPLLSVRRMRPGAPTDVHAIAEIGSIRLDWRPAPRPPLLRRVGEHRAKCTSSDGGRPGSNRVNHRALIVGPLTPGKTYTCVVREANKNGWGPYSAPSNAVVPRPPPVLGAPTITAVTAGVRRITVAFDKPTTDGGQPIRNYRANCASSDGGGANARSGVSSPIVVLGLSAGRTYTCRVVAHNRLGDGPPSTPSAPVVTLD